MVGAIVSEGVPGKPASVAGFFSHVGALKGQRIRYWRLVDGADEDEPRVVFRIRCVTVMYIIS